MSGQFGQPSEKAMNSSNDFLDYVASAATTPGGPPKTTASAYGTPQYAATSFNVSDILQGTLAEQGAQDADVTLKLLQNKALTGDLTGLVNLGAEEVSSFSSKAPSSMLTNATGNPATVPAGTATGTGTTGGVDATSGAVVKDFVAALPLDHPVTKAVLWTRQGKSSREMHIGTSPDINVDIKQHIQAAGLPPNQRHPWYMDRIDGVQGGGTKIYSDPNAASTVLGEDATLAGGSGAFGYLSPEEEQYYCSMAFPYGSNGVDEFQRAGRQDVADKITSLNLKQAAYRSKRILVYSTVTSKACVCTPGDWGPHPYYSTGVVDYNNGAINGFVIGLSPDTHYVLGTNHGDEVMLGWVDDLTPLGPYNGNTSTATSGNSIQQTVPSGPVTNAGGGGQNSIDELIYAGNLIINHPNAWFAQGRNAKATLQGLNATSDHPDLVLYKDAQGHQLLFPALLNYLWYILEGGFILDDYLGAIGYKTKAGDPTNTIVSNHATGGAIDIGKLGLATEGTTVPYTDQKWRTLCDKLFGYLSSLPSGTKGNEIGCSFAYMYPNNFKVYKDANPTHIHLGFEVSQAGTLMNALKRK